MEIRKHHFRHEFHLCEIGNSQPIDEETKLVKNRIPNKITSINIFNCHSIAHLISASRISKHPWLYTTFLSDHRISGLTCIGQPIPYTHYYPSYEHTLSFVIPLNPKTIHIPHPKRRIHSPLTVTSQFRIIGNAPDTVNHYCSAQSIYRRGIYW